MPANKRATRSTGKKGFEVIMWFLAVLFSFSVFAQEYYLPCENGKDIEECSIITDGYYAVKRENSNHAGSTNDTFITNHEAKDVIVKNYKVIDCNVCKNREPSPMLAIKFIVQSRLPKEYWNYVKNNAITDIKKFNENGYLLAFEVQRLKPCNQNSPYLKDFCITQYAVFFKDINDQVRADIGTINAVLLQPDCRNTINLHLDSDFLVSIPQSVKDLEGISQKEAEKSRVDMRIQNCKISYYHKYYAGDVYSKIQKLLKN